MRTHRSLLAALVVALALTACGSASPAEPAPVIEPTALPLPAWASAAADPASVETNLHRAVERLFALEAVDVDVAGDEVRVAFEQPATLTTGQLMIVYLGVLQTAARYAPLSGQVAMTVHVGGEPLATLSAPTEQIRSYALAQMSTEEYLAALELHVP